jgi:hypothetical protein
VGAVGELAVGRSDRFARVHRSFQPNAVVLPEIGVTRTAEHGPVGERSRFLAYPLLPGQLPSPESLLEREP